MLDDRRVTIDLRRREMLLLGLATVLGGCASESKKAVAEAPKEDEPLTGKSAMYRTFPTARQWARDILVLNTSSILLTEYPQKDGTVGGWEITFASPSLRKKRKYRWSNKEIGQNVRQGIFAGLPEDWDGPKGTDQPFSIASVIKDTDEAYKIAVEKQKEFLKKNPDVPVTFELGVKQGVAGLCWAVDFGGKGFTVVYVDVATGKTIKPTA